MATRKPAPKKRTAAKKRTAKKAAAPAPKPLTAPPGQKLFMLDVPFEARQVATYFGSRYDQARRCHVYIGDALPATLQPFAPPLFSWARWQQDEANGSLTRVPGTGEIELRPHQRQAVDLILEAYNEALPGFLLADDVGLGKTFTTIASLHRLEEVETVLVVAPLAVLASWRRALEQYGDGGKRWCLTTWDRLRHLVSVPPSAAQAKTTTTRNKRIADHGRPLVRWDAVVFDESHLARNYASQRSRLARTLSARAFVLWLSATAGQNPLELSYLTTLLAHTTGARAADLADFAQWCVDQGIQVEKGSYGKLSWVDNDEDLERVRSLLFDGRPPAGLRRTPANIDGWPEQQRSLHPVELDAPARQLYQEAWTEFRRQLQLAQRGGDPKAGYVVQMRFIQKASLLRVPAVVELAQTMLRNGRRVFISCKWLETLNAFAEQLTALSIPVATIHGQMSAEERERERVRYQRGDAHVMLATVKEGINLHATDEVADGVPRVTIVHDPRPSAIETKQIEGRGTRDGAHASAYYCFAERTAEEQVVSRAVSRLDSMAAMHGDDRAGVRELDAILTSRALAHEAAFRVD